jgi:hypothetical protein
MLFFVMSWFWRDAWQPQSQDESRIRVGLILASLGKACFVPVFRLFFVGALHATPSPEHQVGTGFLEPATLRLPCGLTARLTSFAILKVDCSDA